MDSRPQGGPAWQHAVAAVMHPLRSCRAQPHRPMRTRARPAFVRLCCALVLALVATACASLPHDVERPVSSALSEVGTTPLGRLVAQSAPSPDVSGFHVVSSGPEAFATLMTLADNATRTLDLQYYLIESDESARELLRRVRAAAERGVRVRLLVDDLHSDGQDHGFLRFAAHKNIEVRMFNPFPAGRFSKVTRVLSSAADLRRVNRRMHNKAFIADNAIAMTGGRNIANAYFLRAPDTNFVDVDVIVAGPAVRRLSEAFDGYWNSAYAFPVESLASAEGPPSTPARPATPAPGAAGAGKNTPTGAPSGGEAAVSSPDQDAAKEAAEAEAEATRLAAKGMTAPRRIDAAGSFLGRQLAARGKLTLEWAQATVVVDDPSKVEPDKAPVSGEATMVDDLSRMLNSATREVILISPYFVPGKRGTEWLGQLVQRGVKVRVLTNSLAATDSPIVHVGYKKYRTDLVKEGVEVHELKSRPGRQQRAISDFSSSQASLHVKAAVADRTTLFVGSMNFDPRSVSQNTETAIIIHSPRLAAQVAQLFASAIDDNSYLLRVSEDNQLQWVDGRGADAKTLDTEPDTTWKQRLWIDVLAPFTPESLL
jgi:putative cardiolipin synthase